MRCFLRNGRSGGRNMFRWPLGELKRMETQAMRVFQCIRFISFSPLTHLFSVNAMLVFGGFYTLKIKQPQINTKKKHKYMKGWLTFWKPLIESISMLHFTTSKAIPFLFIYHGFVLTSQIIVDFVCRISEPSIFHPYDKKNSPFPFCLVVYRG